MNKKPEIIINIYDYAGSFAENKDVARTIREKYLFPALKEGKHVILDYSKVDSTTQSFTHALISSAIKNFKEDFFNIVSFKSCTETVRDIIGIVTEYMQKHI
ncbi:MAG: hypothetical protein A3B16_02890 [Candidatus Zambryskibacteria bacterium RIFCSPLOWO2_01_FULL_45_43]|uniref:DUF4325 domain-containing protein n=2 Tax=Parcubacteria group TaxID=1794811 RepID=A0A1G1ZUH8_9BACT|nr:MAG: hypothetical protein A3H63_00865 [Candidatus Harrisonbacteria bacterium RIFCSPLOWO2_02_FULL_45_10c]OHB06222.1 MAG: hypothetical protein A3B16_02890 [Candidatus Zambryskibacteria bacterium RIFCSPLOWO2_01_FULL_45_43]